MKNFINFLPPWVETNIQPAFYDKESGSVLQQTARMYAKVNQLVRHFNELSKETKETVDEYIAKFVELKDFVDTYFDNLDVQEEVNNKLDELVADGTLQEMVEDIFDYKLTYTDIFFPKTVSGNDPEGFCGVAKTSVNSAILFDLGRTENYTAIKNSLQANGIEKIDAVVISHYHTDHVGNLASYQADFDMTDTVYYLPYPPSNSSLNKFAEIITNYNNLVALIGANTLVKPDNNDEVTIGDYTLRFVNCGAVTTAYWDANTSDYNSYSLVTYLRYGNTTVAFTGDMSIATQGYLFSNKYYEEVDIVTAPHHSHNYEVNSNLLLEYGSTAVYAADSKGITKSIGYQDNFSQGFSIFGAKMYRNTSNDSEIHFYVNKNGYTTAGYNTPIQLYGYSGVITYEVDNTYTGDKSTGSSDHPFTSLRAALEMCKTGGTYVINVTAMSSSGEGVYMRDLHNITINLPDGTLFSTLSLNECSNIFIEPTGIDWYCDALIEIYNCDNVRLRRFTGGVREIRFSNNIQLREGTFTLATAAANVTTVTKSSGVIIQDCSTTLTRDYFVKAEYSDVRIAHTSNQYPNITSIFHEVNRSSVEMGTEFTNNAGVLKAYGDMTDSTKQVIVDSMPAVLHNGKIQTLAQAYRTNYSTSLSFNAVDAIVMVNGTNMFSLCKISGSYQKYTIHGAETGITFAYDTTNNVITVTTDTNSRITAIAIK